MKEYEAVAMVDMISSIKMEFSEIKAEAFSSLGNKYIQSIKSNPLNPVEILTDPCMYFAQELDEAIQASTAEIADILLKYGRRAVKHLPRL